MILRISGVVIINGYNALIPPISSDKIMNKIEV